MMTMCYLFKLNSMSFPFPRVFFSCVLCSQKMRSSVLEALMVFIDLKKVGTLEQQQMTCSMLHEERSVFQNTKVCTQRDRVKVQ